MGLDDPVIEINITPNRPDCLGVRGIARDLPPQVSASSKRKTGLQPARANSKSQ